MLTISCARYEIKEDIALSIIQTNLFQKHHKAAFETRMFILPCESSKLYVVGWCYNLEFTEAFA